MPSQHFLITVHICNNGIAKRHHLFKPGKDVRKFQEDQDQEDFLSFLLSWKKEQKMDKVFHPK